MGSSNTECVRPPRPRPTRISLYKALPVLVLGAGLVLFFVFGLDEHLTFEALRENRADLLAWVDRSGYWAHLLFFIFYAILVAFSVPAGAVLTIAAGFLFGPVLGTAVVVCGATVGATAVFLAARTAFGDYFRSRAAAALERMASGFEDDAFSYLLTLRLIPAFPFWLVNIVPAFTRIQVRTYVLATALGIVPGTIVYAMVGNGLGAVFEAGGEPDLGILLDPQIIAPMVGLALLSLAPAIYKRLRRRAYEGIADDGGDRNGCGEGGTGS